MEINRNGKSSTVLIPDGVITTHSNTYVHVVSWGDKVKLTTTGGSDGLPRTFLRADFDKWLSRVADMGGLA